jgi:hypothetical protein
MPYQGPPFPARDAIVDSNGHPTRALIDWQTRQQTTVDASPTRLRTESVAAQGASISAVPITLGPLAAGLYRVSYYARITRAATSSSSLTVSIGFTDGGASRTLSGAAMTGNTTGTVQSNTWLIRLDQASPVTYSAAYASSGATSMQYDATFVVEQVAA